MYECQVCTYVKVTKYVCEYIDLYVCESENTCVWKEILAPNCFNKDATNVYLE